MAENTTETTADKLRRIAEEAAAGELSAESRFALKQLGEDESEKGLAERLKNLADQADKGGLSLDARTELARIGAQVVGNKIARYQFDGLSHSARAEIIKRGVEIVNAEPPATKRVRPAGALTRSEFDRLAPREQMLAVKSGLRIVDGG